MSNDVRNNRSTMTAIALFAIVVVLIAATAVLGYRNVRLERRLAVEHERMEGLSNLLEQAENRSDRNPHAPDARSPSHDFGIVRDSR